MSKKERLDKLILERFAHLTRNQIQGFIMQGKAKVDGVVCSKSGTPVALDAVITLDEEVPKYVSRAGFKLEKALEHFQITVHDKVALDAGLSTGGFTDCLLQNGIAKVYGVDVGYGQVHESISQNPRVVVMERTNLRNVESLPEPVDIVTLDLSFISVLKIIDRVAAFIKPGGHLIVLVKPQFEARREQVGRGGIVKDPKVHEEVVERIVAGVQEYDFVFQGIVDSPIPGGTAGNKEMLAFFIKN